MVCQNLYGRILVSRHIGAIFVGFFLKYTHGLSYKEIIGRGVLLGGNSRVMVLAFFSVAQGTSTGTWPMWS